MSDKPKVEAVSDQESKIVIGTGTKRWRMNKRLLFVAVLVLVLVSGVAGGVSVYVQRKHVQEQKVAKQRQIESRVNDIDSLGDLTKLKADTESLIQGSNDGTYDVSNKQLAEAYGLRGDTKLNEKNYQGALDDYKKAVALDAARKPYVAYGEFIARYQLGERKELIPLLQLMQKPLKDSFESQNQQQYALYEQYIADLQAGKDLQGIQ